MSHEAEDEMDIKHVLILDEGGNVVLSVQNDTIDYEEKEMFGGILTTLDKIVEAVGGIKTIEFGKYRLFKGAYTTRSGVVASVVLTCERKMDPKSVSPFMLRIGKAIEEIAFPFELTKDKVRDLSTKAPSTAERLSTWVDANT